MQLENAFNNLPTQAEFESFSNSEKKATTENLITKALEQVRHEGRNPTLWEIDRLSAAIGATHAGWYRVAINEVFLSSVAEGEVANAEHWWQEGGDVTMQKLEDALWYVKGAPPR